MLLNPCKISSKMFSFKDMKFVAEISQIRNLNFGKVFDDASDIGFTIVSEKTGKCAVFAMNKIDTDGEDIYGWNFVCVTPGLKNLSALVIND